MGGAGVAGGMISPAKTGTRRSTLYGTQQEIVNQHRLQREQQRQQEMIEIKTVVKQEKDKEVFITDVEDVDFDQLNEQNIQDIQSYFQSENQVSCLMMHT